MRIYGGQEMGYHKKREILNRASEKENNGQYPSNKKIENTMHEDNRDARYVGICNNQNVPTASRK